MQPRLVCLGDSITAGQYAPTEWHWPTKLTGWQVHQEGVSNQTTRDGLRRLPMLLKAFEPDVVLIQYGHNDCNRWETLNGYRRVPLGEFESNLREMISLCHYHGVRVRLVEPHRTLLGGGYESDRMDYVAVMPMLAPGVRVQVSHEHLLDKIHLNEMGHRLYTNTVGEFLKDCL